MQTLKLATLKKFVKITLTNYICNVKRAVFRLIRQIQDRSMTHEHINNIHLYHGDCLCCCLHQAEAFLALHNVELIND